MHFLTLPHDIHATIWRSLVLNDIVRLRQACREMSSAISHDKQLWLHLFDGCLKGGFLIPYNARDVEELEALEIELLIKRSVLLSRAYATTDLKLSSQKLPIQAHLRVTWVKVILGRWCIVAAASNVVSDLSVWEILPNGEVCRRMTIRLEAPVMDGAIDDAEAVRCAITVGATRPYILVLGLYQIGERVSFAQLSRLDGASNLRHFCGAFVGFATHDGDDAYPFLANCLTGGLFPLQAPTSGTRDNLISMLMEPCLSMTISEGFVFTLHRSAVHVFKAPSELDGDWNGSVKYVKTLYFQFRPYGISEVCAGHFLRMEINEHADDQRIPEVRITYQLRDTTLLGASIFTFHDAVGNYDFRMTESIVKLPREFNGESSLHVYQLGICNCILFCAMLKDCTQFCNPELFFGTFETSIEGIEDENECIGNFNAIGKTGLPLSHLLSCVDFDDGNGLLLMATTSSDVRIASILQEPYLSPTGVRNTLGRRPPTEEIMCRVSNPHSGLDLPLFYKIRDNWNYEDPLPPSLLEQVITQWEDPRIGTISVRGWSNDWMNFERVEDWLAPTPRFGPLDVTLEDRSHVTLVRDRLQALGEILPVLYDENNHYRVVFRIGQRLFHFRMERDHVDEQDEFEMHKFGMLGVLPLTYEEFLTDPESILLPLEDRTAQTNLRRWLEPESLNQRRYLIHCVREIRRCLELELDLPVDDATMSCWTDEEWEKHYSLTTATQ